jgi:hypothetical protein
LAILVASGTAALAISLALRRPGTSDVRTTSRATAGNVTPFADAGIAATQTTDGSTDAGGGLSPIPTDPLAAAKYYLDRLESCTPVGDFVAPGLFGRVAVWGRGEPGWGARLELAEDGRLVGARMLRGARRSGRALTSQACAARELANLPRGAGHRALTVALELGELTYGRKASGKIQLLAADEYDEGALPVTIAPEGWFAVCPSKVGTWGLVPARPAWSWGDAVYKDVQQVESRTCPEAPVMLKGVHPNRLTAPDGGADASASDGGRDAAPARADAGTASEPLAAIAVDRTKRLDSTGTNLTLGDRSARVYVREAGRDEMLVYASGDVQQILISAGGPYMLVWAGDLDGDGDLDFVIYDKHDIYKDERDVPRYDLFLSANAGGLLVSRAAGTAVAGGLDELRAERQQQ